MRRATAPFPTHIQIKTVLFDERISHMRPMILRAAALCALVAAGAAAAGVCARAAVEAVAATSAHSAAARRIIWRM